MIEKLPPYDLSNFEPDVMTDKINEIVGVINYWQSTGFAPTPSKELIKE